MNGSTGVHVHVGWKRDWPSEALARLVTIVAYVEKGLYAITGTKHRERGHYCGGVRRYGNKDHAKDRIERGRYHALNLTNLAHGTKDTVEFRVFSGSLQVVKVLGWIQVCLEHDGFARQKAVVWWKKRSKEPVPTTAAEAVEIANAGGLAATTSITVRSVSGEEYDRITDHVLGPLPEPLDRRPEAEAEQEDPFDFPFGANVLSLQSPASSLQLGEEEIPF